MYQVYANYPSGNRYPVREPHETRAGASWHVELCRKSADPRDTWMYSYSEVDAEKED
jgi:hypothetical protein